uniref:Metal response element binding transcription factor 2 n=1 Tax=Cavia porcellus TaxID=10141 RepID=A0A286XKM1_CAVPO
IDSTGAGNSLVHKRSPLRRNQKTPTSLTKLSLQDGQKAKKPACKFEEGQDVLARWSDGLFYLGTIKKINILKQSCFIIFEDSSKSWVLWKDIQTGRCYYLELFLDENTYCLWIQGGALKKGPNAKALQVMKQTLPYSVADLEWDAGHKTNVQQCYCYCGGPGDWYLKMLQCCKCKQWFHEACVQCLQKPMLFGDRFYTFICSVCSSGPEYLKRLPLQWVDIAHLCLYNLSVIHKKKYFDSELELMTYINENWDRLHPGELADTPKSERYEHVLEALNDYKTIDISNGIDKKGKKKSVGRPPGPYTRKMIQKTAEPPLDKDSVSENPALDLPCSIGITEGTAHSSNTSDMDFTGASSTKETTSSSISRHYGLSDSRKRTRTGRSWPATIPHLRRRRGHDEVILVLAGRIACGEKYRVLARRVTLDGKVQYLVEWEGATAS